MTSHADFRKTKLTSILSIRVQLCQMIKRGFHIFAAIVKRLAVGCFSQGCKFLSDSASFLYDTFVAAQVLDRHHNVTPASPVHSKVRTRVATASQSMAQQDNRSVLLLGQIELKRNLSV